VRALGRRLVRALGRRLVGVGVGVDRSDLVRTTEAPVRAPRRQHDRQCRAAAEQPFFPTSLLICQRKRIHLKCLIGHSWPDLELPV